VGDVEENAEIVRRGIAAYNRRDFEALAAAGVTE
jgi:hypothetical protein